MDRFDRFQRCEYWFGMLGRGCTWGGKLFNEYTQELIRENRAITRKVRKDETWLGRHETCFDCLSLTRAITLTDFERRVEYSKGVFLLLGM